MKVHIFVLGSPVIVNVELPDGTSFVNWCKMIRADSGIFSDQLHLPYDKIIGIGVGDTVKNFVSPGTDTKQ